MGTRILGAALAVVTCLAGTGSLSAAILFEDNFDVDPSLNGWTEEILQGTDTTNLADIVSTGSGEARFLTDYNGSTGTDNETFRITRTIDATGWAGLFVTLYGDEPTLAEAGDSISVQVSTNGGASYTTLASVSNEVGMFTLGPVAAGAATDNTGFLLRVESINNAEDYRLDRIVVEGPPPVIYSDGFTLDPETAGSTDRVGFSDGWTEDLSLVTNGGSIDDNGLGQAVFSRTTSDTSPDADDYVSITHAFSTVGYKQIVLELIGSQNDTVWESDDELHLQYSLDGVTFVDAFVDAGYWGTSPAGGPRTSGLVLLPSGASDNPDFAVRIFAEWNASSEMYLFDQLNVRGVLIPTPAALPGGLMIIGLIAGRRRGARARRAG